MRKLRGSTALVTGASAGIGAHVARALAAEGMNLSLAARSGDKLEKLAAELKKTGVQAIAVETDVTVHDSLRNVVQETVDAFGAIDVLVNNAGVESFCQFEELEIDEILRTIDTNLTSTLVLTRLVIPHMLRAKRGHIVNMASTAGKFGPAYGSAYGASKAGMIAFTESLRGEYKGTGVSASAICPGFTDDGGIYERMKREIGLGTPALLGHTTARAVAAAVVKAIQKDRPEVIVNSPPMRPMAVLCEMCPRTGQWITRFASRKFLRRVAQSRRDDA